MWSLSTNNIFGAILVVAWLIWGVNFVGDMIIEPFEPVMSEASADEGAPAQEEAAAPEPEEPLPVLLAAADASRGETVAKKCVSCHTFDKDGKNKIGPNLYNIVGADIAKVANFSYSGALSDLGGKWTFENLNAFLLSPKSFAKGTKMTFSGLKKGSDRAAILTYMRDQADSPVPLPQP